MACRAELARPGAGARLARARCPLRRAWAGLCLACACAGGAAQAQAQGAPPPNLVPINERLITSGQPSAEWLGQLKAQGYGAVIYLAPATVSDALKDEGLIVSRQGLVFVNLPIAFDNPTAQDVQSFFALLQALSGAKVLVHCQVNLRASSLVFLYRVIVGREDPQPAFDAVSQVWQPEGAWKRLIQAQLRQHGIKFELL